MDGHLYSAIISLFTQPILASIYKDFTCPEFGTQDKIPLGHYFRILQQTVGCIIVLYYCVKSLKIHVYGQNSKMFKFLKIDACLGVPREPYIFKNLDIFESA